MSEYYIYTTMISGEQLSFRVGQLTADTVERRMADRSRFVWINDNEAINLDNIERITIQEA